MGQAHSASGKAGVDALTRVFANKLGPKHIRVNVIAPGFIADTVGIRKLQLEQKQQAYSDLIPLGRYGTKFDIGQAALYLYGADYVTGHCLVVDGGQWLISNQLVTFDEDYKKLWRAGRL
jgi:NAD(P)-dependent dehydrogenase (short-subunit alcohol dehydrogenase family)